MASESRLPIAIFGAIVAIIALPFLIDQVRERRRPVLVEARIVTATGSDPVFREGRRRVPPGELIEVALALRLQRAGGQDQWMSPAARLEIDGAEVQHIQSSTWPDDGRSLRVFWFSVECANLGGRLTAESAAERLRYRTFLAPEMGRDLMAVELPEAHNNDHIGDSGAESPGGAGTTRLYARIEVVEGAQDILSLQSTTTFEVDRILDPGFPTILRSGDLGEGIDPSAGELFRLPGFEPEGESKAARNSVTNDALNRTFNQLVDERIVVSSWTLAASAIGGRADLDPSELSSLGEVRIDGDRINKRNRNVEWGEEVQTGDLLADGDHWLVLLADNGNGVLDLADSVVHCWGRPPERTTLFAATGSATRLHHYRRVP